MRSVTMVDMKTVDRMKNEKWFIAYSSLMLDYTWNI